MKQAPPDSSTHTDPPVEDKGVFRGRLGRTEKYTNNGMLGMLPTVIRYFTDPTVSRRRKGLILAGILYVISPIDLVPGALLPMLGWLDDAVVATFAWRLLSTELTHYTKTHF